LRNKATVIRSTGSWYEVETVTGEIVKCRIKGKFRLQGMKLTNPVAVGDIVDIEIEDIKEKTGIIKNIHPRKNIANLIKAFDLFKSKTDNNYHLAIIGRPAWKTEEYYKALDTSPYRNYIVTKQLKREDLPEVIGSSDAMFYVSLFEGFGIPILEGFEAGIPVVTSNTSSMPEVANDAAILVNPKSIESIANAMKEISESKTLRQSLIKKGFERLKNFSWDKSAAKTYEIIKSVADAN